MLTATGPRTLRSTGCGCSRSVCQPIMKQSFFFFLKGSSFLLPKLPACPQLHTKLVENLNKLKGKGPGFTNLKTRGERNVHLEHLRSSISGAADLLCVL